jgi:hypothetical protein
MPTGEVPQIWIVLASVFAKADISRDPVGKILKNNVFIITGEMGFYNPPSFQTGITTNWT